MQRFVNTRQLVLAALMTALGISLNIIESMLPLPIPFPGTKIGLANVAVLLCLYVLPLKITTCVFVLRIMLASLLLGTFLSSSFFIGGFGGVLSFIVMVMVKKIPSVSLLGVSIAGAAAHNFGQVLIASFIISNAAILYYLPVVLLISIPAGFFTGFVAKTGVELLSNKIK